jgi:hypothetical protein
MTTYAQTYDDYAHNVVVGETFEQAIENVYNPDWVQTEIDAGRPWAEVPDGTLANAKYENGVWTNPTIPIPTPQPIALTKSQFQTLYLANGNDLTATLANWPTA